MSYTIVGNGKTDADIIYRRKMSNILTYKGYITKVLYSSEDEVFFGKIENIKDLVNFESNSAIDIEAEFRKAVDDYIKIKGHDND